MHYARKYFSNTIKMLLSYSLLYGDKNKLNDYIYKYIYIYRFHVLRECNFLSSVSPQQKYEAQGVRAGQPRREEKPRGSIWFLFLHVFSPPPSLPYIN